jgi:hypothetical protein
VTSGERAAIYGGLGAGGVLLVVVADLLQRTLVPAREIERYARHVDEAARAIAGNTEAVEELAKTRELALAVPQLAGAYLENLGVGHA